MYLQDRGGAGPRRARPRRANTLLGKAGAESTLLAGVRPNTLEDAPQLQLDVDRVQAQAMGLSVSDIYSAIQLMLAPVYVNDFIYGGRVKRVTMQADAPLPHGPRRAAAHLHAERRRRPAAGGGAGDDSAVQCRQHEVGCVARRR